MPTILSPTRWYQLQQCRPQNCSTNDSVMCNINIKQEDQYDYYHYTWLLHIVTTMVLILLIGMGRISGIFSALSEASWPCWTLQWVTQDASKKEWRLTVTVIVCFTSSKFLISSHHIWEKLLYLMYRNVLYYCIYFCQYNLWICQYS